MGIPRFGAWIIQRYPFIQVLLDDPLCPKIDCLFIDFNSTIVTNFRHSFVPESNNQTDTITTILLDLEKVVAAVNPRKLIFISVDGVPSIAKVNTQRERRMDNKYNNEYFTTTAFTVGTEFTEELHQRLLAFLKERKKSGKFWQQPNVIYSSYHTPGEGEHKIFEQIYKMRNNKTWDDDFVSAIYSPDSDVYLCSLLSQASNLFILKELKGKAEKPRGIEKIVNRYSLDSIDILKEVISIEMTGKPGIDPKAINDFFFISALLGNDFLPKIKNMDIQHHFLENSFAVYREKLYPSKLFFINDEGFCSEGIKAYAKEFFRDKGPPTPEIALEYMRGIHVLFQTYKTGQCNWNWYYPYNETTSFESIVQIIDNVELTKDRGLPLHPIVQSLLTISPSSKKYVPKPLQYIIELVGEDDSKIDPGPSVKLVLQEFNKSAGKLTQKEKYRNELFPFFKFPSQEHIETDRQLPITIYTGQYDCVCDFDSITFKPVKRDIEFKPGQIVGVGFPFRTPAKIISLGSTITVTLLSHGKDGPEITFNVKPEEISEIEQEMYSFHKQMDVSFHVSTCLVVRGPNSCSIGTLRDGQFVGTNFDFSRSQSLFYQPGVWVSLAELAAKFGISSPLLLFFMGNVNLPSIKTNIGLKLISDKKGVPCFTNYFQNDYQVAVELVPLLEEYMSLLDPIKEFFPLYDEQDSFLLKIKQPIKEKQEMFNEWAEKVTHFAEEKSPGYKYNKLHLRFHFPHFSFFKKAESFMEKLPRKSIKCNPSRNQYLLDDKERKLMEKKAVGTIVGYIGMDGIVPFGTMGVVIGIFGNRCYVMTADEIAFGTTFFGYLNTQRVFEANAESLSVLKV